MMKIMMKLKKVDLAILVATGTNLAQFNPPNYVFEKAIKKAKALKAMQEQLLDKVREATDVTFSESNYPSINSELLNEPISFHTKDL